MITPNPPSGGFIVVGVLLGNSLTGLLEEELLISLTPLTGLALGFIGFMIGGELKAGVFRKYDSQRRRLG